MLNTASNNNNGNWGALPRPPTTSGGVLGQSPPSVGVQPSLANNHGNGLPTPSSPHHSSNGVRAPHMIPGLDLMRPPRTPFFVREIYKNGFLKRLNHNEKKSSPLSKLMRTDRFWVVFSIHDDAHPFLELWNDPTEVSSKSPQFVYPLGICQHISPSLTPAVNEWSFVINFEVIAIRFACNSRSTMMEWVECIRNKLEDMGIMNPKGNLYSKTPLVNNPPKIPRNPMSPLPSPPPDANNVLLDHNSNDQHHLNAIEGTPRNRQSIVDASDQTNFTTSIYLNQSPPSSPEMISNGVIPVTTTTSLTTTSSIKQKISSSLSLDSNLNKSYESIAPPYPVSNNNSTVYLNPSSPTARHVTVIPINRNGHQNSDKNSSSDKSSVIEEGLYSAIDDDQTMITSKRNQISPVRRQRPLSLAEDPGQPVILGASATSRPTRYSRHEEFIVASKNSSDSKVSRRASDKKNGLAAADKGYNIQQRVRKKSQRSSSLGPLLNDTNEIFLSGGLRRLTNTNSLESIDSNPRQAVSKSERVRENSGHHYYAQLGAVPRRPIPHPPSNGQHPSNTETSNSSNPSHNRHLSEANPGIRPHPPYPVPSYPPHIPLPGLTFNISQNNQGGGGFTPGSNHPVANSNSGNPEQHATMSIREKQVIRLRQEIGHPAGVRLVLRTRDCQNSLALVEVFGYLWVAGWKQREFPVLYNAFHVGDQIISVCGSNVRNVNEFFKAIKQQQQSYVEIIIRRLPFAQVFHIRREIEGQPLGISTHGSSPEIKDIGHGSPAAIRGMTPKIRSFDGQALVPWIITEINGRPISLFSKDNEAGDRLKSLGRDISVLVQPADIVQRLKKQLKSIKSHKDYILS